MSAPTKMMVRSNTCSSTIVDGFCPLLTGDANNWRVFTAVLCFPDQRLHNEQFVSSQHHSHSFHHRAQFIHHHAAASLRRRKPTHLLPHPSLTSPPLLPLPPATTVHPRRLWHLRKATSASYARCPTTLSVQVSSVLSVRPYARVQRALTGLFPNAVNTLAGGSRGRNCATKALRQVSSASSAAVPRVRVPQGLTPHRLLLRHADLVGFGQVL